MTQTQCPFKIGDTVQLKSGGPIMTVTVVMQNTVTCVWFADKEKKQDKFNCMTLTPAG